MASELTPVPDDLDFGVTVRGLVVSQRVFGRYTLRHVLGRGGMGVVWLARDEQLERDVALKFLPEAVNFDAAALDDLKRETRRCLDLTHPNIIRIYDFVKDPQAAAISMEYIDGKTLSALRIEQEHRIFEVEEIQEWISQACQALFYAHHDVKVVHRDLKPANLMLTSRRQLKIADFGIARSVSDSVSQVTMKTGTSGTLVYMSPQQMNGEMSKVTDDIYALGATIYELLTSKPPFFSGDIPFQVRETTPRKMGERREDLSLTGQPIPQEWEDAIAACLAKNPSDRPQDTYELAQRLGLHTTAMHPRTSAATVPSAAADKSRPTAPKKTAPKLPRKPFPTRLVLTGAGAVAGVVLLGWLLWSFVLWPFIATPGTVTVGSVPSGATVHLSGQQDLVTPAQFPKVRVGHYKVIISLAGYDPDEEHVTVNEAQQVDLGTIALKRAFGKFNLVTLPPRAHYELNGTGNSNKDVSKEGTTPDYLANLPAGSYQLSLSAPGMSDHTATVEIPAHAVLAETDDLVKLSVAADASPDAAKALLGQTSDGSLDDKTKAEYLDLLKASFTKYLDADLLVAATDTINKLKGFGQDTSTLEKQLADRRTVVQKQSSAQIGELITDKKFATAQATLDGLSDQLDPDSFNQLKTQYQPQLDQYSQQVNAAVELSQNGDVNAAYTQLKAFAAPYPDDLKLQLALATVETRMPPDHDRLTARLKSFRQLAADNRAVVENSDFQAMQDKFTRELAQLDELAAALDKAKNGSGNLQGQLNDLEDRRAAIENRSVDVPQQVVTSFFNGLSRSLTGRNVFTQEQKNEELADLDGRIANVKQEISTQDSSGQNSVEEAQKQYDDFVAHVPW